MTDADFNFRDARDPEKVAAANGLTRVTDPIVRLALSAVAQGKPVYENDEGYYVIDWDSGGPDEDDEFGDDFLIPWWIAAKGADEQDNSAA